MALWRRGNGAGSVLLKHDKVQRVFQLPLARMETFHEDSYYVNCCSS